MANSKRKLKFKTLVRKLFELLDTEHSERRATALDMIALNSDLTFEDATTLIDYIVWGQNDGQLTPSEVVFDWENSKAAFPRPGDLSVDDLVHNHAVAEEKELAMAASPSGRSTLLPDLETYSPDPRGVAARHDEWTEYAKWLAKIPNGWRQTDKRMSHRTVSDISRSHLANSPPSQMLPSVCHNVSPCADATLGCEEKRRAEAWMKLADRAFKAASAASI